MCARCFIVECLTAKLLLLLEMCDNNEIFLQKLWLSAMQLLRVTVSSHSDAQLWHAAAVDMTACCVIVATVCAAVVVVVGPPWLPTLSSGRSESEMRTHIVDRAQLTLSLQTKASLKALLLPRLRLLHVILIKGPAVAAHTVHMRRRLRQVGRCHRCCRC